MWMLSPGNWFSRSFRVYRGFPQIQRKLAEWQAHTGSQPAAENILKCFQTNNEDRHTGPWLAIKTPVRECQCGCWLPSETLSAQWLALSLTDQR